MLELLLARGEEVGVVFSFDFLPGGATVGAFSPEPEERSSWDVKKVKLIHSCMANTNTSSTVLRAKEIAEKELTGGKKKSREEKK